MPRQLLKWAVAIATIFATTAELRAQLQIQLVMSPNPSPYISDWQERKETALFQVFNRSTKGFQMKIQTRVYLNGTLKAETKLPDMPVLSIGPSGTAVYYA